MRWVDGINPILGNYITVIPIQGNDLMILTTLLAAILITWAIELRQGVEDKTEEKKIDGNKNWIKDIILPLIILISPLVLNRLYPMISEIYRSG